MDKKQYAHNWKEIADKMKAKFKYRCERCDHPHDLKSGHVLTVHHLDGDKKNNEPWNLAVLCQRCHLSVQGRVKMGQMIFSFFPVSKWFIPHLKGYLKWVSKNNKVMV